MRVTQSEQLKSFCWLPNAGLPAALRRYVDPDQRLQQVDCFIRSANASLLYLCWGLFWLTLAGSFALALTWELIGRLTQASSTATPTENGLPVLVLLALLAASVCAAWRSWRYLKRCQESREASKAGRLRDGLFLLDGGLLLHRSAQSLYLPKESIVDFKEVQRGRGESSDLQIHYRTESGASKLSLLRLDLDITTAVLHRRLRSWWQSTVSSCQRQ